MFHIWDGVKYRRYYSLDPFSSRPRASQTREARLREMGLADEILAFRIEKKVTIQNWRVGAVHKVSQLLVVVIVILQLYMENTWAYSEVPKGSVNAFAESGNSADHRELTDTSELSHCGSSPGVNSENSYAYDAFFVMDNPLCLNLHPYEIARKGIGELSFTTAFIEMTQIGPLLAPALDSASRLHSSLRVDRSCRSCRPSRLSATPATPATPPPLHPSTPSTPPLPLGAQAGPTTRRTTRRRRSTASQAEAGSA
jgi:hypothetical protein